MQTLQETGHHNRKQTSDEAARLRRQLDELVKEVRRTIAHPARPEALREVLDQSQSLLR